MQISMRFVVLSAVVVACSGGSPNSGPDGGTDSGGADGTSDGPISDGGGDSGSDGGGAPTIDLGSTTVTALAANGTTMRVYAAVEDDLGNGAGIVVVDATTNTVTTTIPVPASKASWDPKPIFSSLFVDTAANRIYAGGMNQNHFFVFDGSTNALVGELTPAKSGLANLSIRGFALDSTNHLLYVLDDYSGPVVVDAIGLTVTADWTPSSPPFILGATQFNGKAASHDLLALDTKTNRLFVGGIDTANGNVATEALDTTTGKVVASTETEYGANLNGTQGTTALLGLHGYAGFASAFMTDAAGNGTLYLLEPATYKLPTGYRWLTYGTFELPSSTIVTFTGTYVGDAGGTKLVVLKTNWQGETNLYKDKPTEAEGLYEGDFLSKKYSVPLNATVTEVAVTATGADGGISSVLISVTSP